MELIIAEKLAQAGASSPLVDLRAFIAPHFRWLELLHTEHREFLAEQYAPPDFVRVYLTALANDLLEDLRRELGPMKTSSGYRCPGLNGAVGGSGSKPGQKPSAHMAGRACDFHPLDCSEAEAMERIAARVPWALDKAIYECFGGGCWIHAQIAERGQAPRRQLLMTFDGASYAAWNPQDPRVVATGGRP
jgi:hypothetical protein